MLTFQKASHFEWALECCASFVTRKGFVVSDPIKYFLHQEIYVQTSVVVIEIYGDEETKIISAVCFACECAS